MLNHPPLQRHQLQTAALDNFAHLNYVVIRIANREETEQFRSVFVECPTQQKRRHGFCCANPQPALSGPSAANEFKHRGLGTLQPHSRRVKRVQEVRTPQTKHLRG
jgi:hypothetical protein